MLRLFWSAFALVCGIVQASSAPPTPPQDDSGSAPMRFEWRREGPAETCGANCRVWISAVGYITADTPREFETFANDPNVHGAVLVLDSDGGSVLGTLTLGRAIRSLDMITTIGRTTALARAGNGERRATLSPEGSCESMCAFLLLAGARRYVPPEAHVLVHQIWLGKKRKQALEFELFGRGAQHRPARHRPPGAIHHGNGRQRRVAGNGVADSAVGAVVSAFRGRTASHEAHDRRGAVRARGCWIAAAEIDDIAGDGRPACCPAGLGYPFRAARGDLAGEREQFTGSACTGSG